MDEDIFIPLIFFAFIFMTVRMILLHRRQTLAKKLEAQTSTTESGSLRTSELKTLIREAVEEANIPLVERVEAIEHLLEHDAPRLLAEPDMLEPIEVDALPASPVRKHRTR